MTKRAMFKGLDILKGAGLEESQARAVLLSMEVEWDDREETFREWAEQKFPGRSEMHDLRVELKTEMHDLRVELKTEMQELRVELTDKMHALETRMGHLDTKMLQMENRLIKWMFGLLVSQAVLLLGGMVFIWATR